MIAALMYAWLLVAVAVVTILGAALVDAWIDRRTRRHHGIPEDYQPEEWWERWDR